MESESVRTIPDTLTPEQLAEQLAGDSRAESAGEAPEPPKRKRGRPPGSKTRKSGGKAPRAAGNAVPGDSGAEPEPAEPELTPEQQAAIMQAVVGELSPVVYALVAPQVAKKTPDNPYTQDQARELTTAALPVAAKYGGGAVLKYAPELTLAGIIAKQFFARPEHAPESGRDVSNVATD